MSRTPQGVHLLPVPQLPLWPVEIREPAVAIESGNSVSLTGRVTGVLESPYEPSPPADAGLQATV